VEYCGSRTEPCTACGQFVKLRDTKLHQDSNCTLPAVAVPPPSGSNGADDFVCDGMDVYHLSQLDQLLCHDVATNMLWSPSSHVSPGRASQFGRGLPPMVRWNNQSRRFVRQNHPRGTQFADRRGEGILTEPPRNNEFVDGRTPKVVSGPQIENFTSLLDTDDAGKNPYVGNSDALFLCFFHFWSRCAALFSVCLSHCCHCYG